MIVSAKDTKAFVKEYWGKKGINTIRVDNLPAIMGMFNDRMMLAHEDPSRFSWISSHTQQFNKLFKHRVRRAGEYSWSYQYVLDYIKPEIVSGNLRIIMYTEKGKGTGYEYVSGRKDLVVPFLNELAAMVEKEFKLPNERPN